MQIWLPIGTMVTILFTCLVIHVWSYCIWRAVHYEEQDFLSVLKLPLACNECAQYWLYSAHYFGSNKSAWWTINCQYDCWTEKHLSVSVLKRKSLTHRFKLKFKSMSKACVLVFTVFKRYLDLQQYLSNLWATAPRLAVCFRWTFSEWIWSNCPLNQECLSNL